MNERFGKISEIEVDDPETWQDRIFLTFDIDWAHDEILKDTIGLVEQAGVAATWFVTHETPILERLRSNPQFELGIHPNFNFLLNGDPCKGVNAEEVVDRVLSIVPEAKSVRSHSMTQSTRLMQLFRNKGLRYDCNYYIPGGLKFDLKPWVLWNKLIKVPHLWEDDLFLLYHQATRPILDLQRQKGLKVFDFHPIHVFLNTEEISRYERTRHMHHDPIYVKKHRHTGHGMRKALEALIEITL